MTPQVEFCSAQSPFGPTAPRWSSPRSRLSIAMTGRGPVNGFFTNSDGGGNISHNNNTQPPCSKRGGTAPVLSRRYTATMTTCDEFRQAPPPHCAALPTTGSHGTCLATNSAEDEAHLARRRAPRRATTIALTICELAAGRERRCGVNQAREATGVISSSVPSGRHSFEDGLACLGVGRNGEFCPRNSCIIACLLHFGGNRVPGGAKQPTDRRLVDHHTPFSQPCY